MRAVAAGGCSGRSCRYNNPPAPQPSNRVFVSRPVSDPIIDTAPASPPAGVPRPDPPEVPDRRVAIGVDQPDEALRRSRASCKRIATGHYENFLVASVLLPRPMRQPFYDVYAFCRTADDLADESSSPAAAWAGLKDYRRRIAGLFDGRPGDGIFIALADTIHRYDLPREPFDDLLEAFEQDQRVTRYADTPQLLDYCRRSANPVGRLVLGLAGVDDAKSQAMSDSICTGLQLANFWQDVARDFAKGRIYLPANAMADYGVREPMLAGKTTPPPVRELMAQLVGQTRGYFEAGRPLINRVPRWLAADMELFIGGGVATLGAIERSGFDVVARRVTVSKWRQASMVARAWWSRGRDVETREIGAARRLPRSRTSGRS